jgi:hypothetical protein
MPMPATHHAMIAPSGPVARAKLRGNEKMPAPTIDPTTIAVNAGNDSFGSTWDAIVHHSEKLTMRDGSAGHLHFYCVTSRSSLCRISSSSDVILLRMSSL